MPMATEDERQSQPLTLTREPKGPKRAGAPGTMGDQALMDAVYLIAAGWAVLFLLAWTLRRHNI